jgi:hypothetical protein
MPGLMLRLLSTSVSSTAAPLQGSPLMFHAVDARRPHLPRMVFSAATAHTRNARVRDLYSFCISVEPRIVSLYISIMLHCDGSWMIEYVVCVRLLVKHGYRQSVAVACTFDWISS